MSFELGVILISLFSLEFCSSRSYLDHPNFVLIVADDVGYGDLASYGHPTQEFNEIDQLALEGIRFTQWYSTAPVCTPSRAAILTGSLPVQMGMQFPHIVYLPCDKIGLPKSQLTVAQMLKNVGYKTGFVGKWHLGINEHHFQDGAFLPHYYGFEDVRTFLPFTLNWNSDRNKRHRQWPLRQSSFLYYNRTIIQQPIDLDFISVSLLNDAKAFIHDNFERPFFLLLSLLQAHTPMFNMQQFVNKSRRGIYGDQINEMAWMVGEIKTLLQKLKIDNNTLILFISDNGPHTEICEEGGSAGIFRGSKMTYNEGGLRVPAIAWWPGVIEPLRVDSTVISSLDIMPTFRELAGINVASEWPVLGKSFAHILKSKTHGVKSLHNIMFFYDMEFLISVRYKNLKVHFRKYPQSDKVTLQRVCKGNFPLYNYVPVSEVSSTAYELQTPEIYDIEVDPGEKHPLPIEDYLGDLKIIFSNIKEFENTLPKRETAKQFLKTCPLSIIPCCNPPYCFCNFPGSMNQQSTV